MYDVAILCDLRTADLSGDVLAQVAAGRTVVLIHTTREPGGAFHPATVGLLRAGHARLALAGDRVRAALLVTPDDPLMTEPAWTVADRVATRLDRPRTPVLPQPRDCAPPAPRATRVLLIGYRTERLLAVARRLPATLDPVLVTGSATLPETSLLTEHLPDVNRAAFVRDRLRHLIELHDARIVVLDGVPEDGLLAATADHPDVAWLWLRAGMWRRGHGEKWRGRASAFAAVCEPGEFAAGGDEGWTAQDRTEVRTVEPITMLDRAALLDRDAARAALNLTGEPAVVLRGVAAEVPGFTVIDPSPRALRAADLAVATAGYTDFHELLAAGVPTVFVPDPASGSDDQTARARFAAAAGAALHAEDTSVLDGVLAEAARPEVRARLATRCAELAFGNGAAGAAAWITSYAKVPAGV